MPTYRKDTSYQAFTSQWGWSITLQYRRKEKEQLVYCDGVLMSSLMCSPGIQCTHSFRTTKKAEGGRPAQFEFAIRFAVDSNTYQIRYEIACRRTADEIARWDTCAWNLDPTEWDGYSNPIDECTVRNTCEQCNTQLRCAECDGGHMCVECGSQLTCPSCESQEDTSEDGGCDGCGETLRCPYCDVVYFLGEENDASFVFDSTRAAERLRDVDAESLKDAIGSFIERSAEGDHSWPAVLNSILDELGISDGSIRVGPVIDKAE
jgi:hypothetical protein